MFGKLKEGIIDKALAAIEPVLGKVLEKLSDLPPETVQDDDSFRKKFVGPTVLVVAAASGGASSLIPRFNQRVEKTLFHARDELVVDNGGKVGLVEGYRQRLGPILREGFKE